MPSLSFSIRDHLSWSVSGVVDISYAFWLSVCKALQSSTWVSFSPGLSGESAQVHRQRLAFAASVRSKMKKKKNSKKTVRRRTERRRQQQRGGNFQRASIMFYTYTRITCRYGLDKAMNRTKTTSKHTSTTRCISLYLSIWRLKFQLHCHFGD